jgi:hypothetical protein
MVHHELHLNPLLSKAQPVQESIVEIQSVTRTPVGVRLVGINGEYTNPSIIVTKNSKLQTLIVCINRAVAV